MNLSKYTTQELEFIISNFDDLKRELKKRNIIESDNFTFEIGDVIHSKDGNDNFLLKIKEIDIINNSVITDKIVIRDRGLFGAYVDEWFDIDTTEWYEYTKIDDSEIFENLLKIIDKYNDDVQQLNDDVYLKFKKELSSH